MSRIYKIVGPPGTGKTTELARQGRRAAEVHGGDGVAIVSLTRAAAAEIGGRDSGVPAENCTTLHAACYRALDRPDLAETADSMKEFAATSGYQVSSASSTQALEDDPEPYSRYSQAEAGSALHAVVANHRARRTARAFWRQHEREYADAWDDFKRRTGRLDFTDLIERCLADRVAHPAAPRVLLLDEAQDSSALELALAQQWAADCETAVIVGDTDQALYTWRGSDPGVIDDMACAGARTLEQSYRVPVAVHGAATRWIAQIPGRRDVVYRPTEIEGAVERANISLRWARDIAQLAHEKSKEGETQVLVSCSYMLSSLLAELRAAGIPFHNPHRAKAGAWNPMRGAGPLKAFLRPLGEVWGEQARMWTWDDLRRWTDPLKASDALARGAKAAIDEHCREGKFGESRADEEVPLETLRTLLGSDEHPAFTLDVDWWAARLRAGKTKSLAYALAVLQAQGGRALTQTPKLVVGTIHAAKGTEADHVILAPDLSRTGYWEGWHSGGRGRDAIVRMFYVALTRARHTVTVIEPSRPEHVDPYELVAGAQTLRAAA